VPIRWGQVAERAAAACTDAAAVKWEQPYPYVALPSSTEVSFGKLGGAVDGMGDIVVSRLISERAGIFKFDLLNEQDFLLGEEIRSSGVWAQPEPWGTWLCGTEGELEFYVAFDDSPWCYVFLRLRVNGPLSESTVRLMVNGTRLWNRPIGDRSRNIMLRVRRKSKRADWWRLRIRAEVDATPGTIGEIGMTDPRVPTLGFENLIVVPEKDVGTRVDILTKLSPMLAAEGNAS
jgi:hypothetical protein